MTNKTVRRGELWFADLVGAEGCEIKGPRPVVVLQNDQGNYYSSTIMGVPLTSNTAKRGIPTHVEVGTGEHLSVALCEQLRTLDKSRLLKRLGRVTNAELIQIEKAVSIALDLDEETVDTPIDEESRVTSIPVDEDPAEEILAGVPMETSAGDVKIEGEQAQESAAKPEVYVPGTEFSVLYRDASNYKASYTVKFRGRLQEDVLLKTLRAVLMDGLYFLPDMVGLQDPREVNKDEVWEWQDQDDWLCCELYLIGETMVSPDAADLADFLEALKANTDKWEEESCRRMAEMQEL